jgi:Tfp pilus assembly protein PilF/cbb3-type cytochrome oxidase subunit 3
MGEMQSSFHEGTFTDRKRLILLLGLLLVVETVVLYVSAVRNGFVNFDDPDYVTGNPPVLHGISWPNIVWAFGADNPAANWHPLTWISHMLDVEWYGRNPTGHHFTSVLLFALDVLLLFLFLERATGQVLRSAAVAMLFAVHPLNVESVAWIAERKSVLSLLFMFMALLAYVWHTRKPGAGRFLCVVVLFALALMAKIMVITLPFGLLLLDYWPLQRFADPDVSGRPKSFLSNFRALLVEKIPLFLLSAAAAWMTLHVHRREGSLSGMMPLAWRIKNAVFSYVAYIEKIIWPSRLAVFYPHPENSLPWWKVIVAGAILAGVTAIAGKFRKKKYLLVGWLWYLGMLFPMIGLVQSGRQGMADRYACISLIGVFIAVVWLAGDWASRGQVRDGVVAALFVALLCPYSYVTRTQIGYWRDSYTLFAHALEVTSGNGIAENNFGAALVEIGEAPLALPHFEAAVRLIPGLASAHYNLGIALQGQNRLDEAARQYRLAIATSTDRFETAQAHNNLGALYLQAKNLGAAKSEFTAAIALNPGEFKSYVGRGMIEQQGWNFDAAIADFSRASEIAPSPLAYFWLGRALESKGEVRRAEEAYKRALQLAPGMTDAQARLAALRSNASKN